MCKNACNQLVCPRITNVPTPWTKKKYFFNYIYRNAEHVLHRTVHSCVPCTRISVTSLSWAPKSPRRSSILTHTVSTVPVISVIVSTVTVTVYCHYSTCHYSCCPRSSVGSFGWAPRKPQENQYSNCLRLSSTDG